MCYDSMVEIATYLKRKADIEELSSLQEMEQEGKLYLTLWGHYSSGKSCLINHLLGRDILPVRSKETTAALTYISYGETENAFLFMDDGNVEGISLDEVKRLFEGSTADDGRLAHVEHIEISLHEEWLNHGLVLVDTPGVNTILQRHQELALSAVKQAGRILYCLGGAPSKVDADFIKMMVDSGITVTFVRTKCDLFHEEEENPNDALQIEKENLETIAGQQNIEFYPLSNEKEATVWYEKGNALKEFLMALSEHASEEVTKSCEKRVAIFKQAYAKDLTEQLESYQNMLHGESAKQQEKLDECEHQIKRMQQNIEKRTERMKADVERSKKQAENSVQTMVKQRSAAFANAIDGFTNQNSLVDDIENAYEQQMKKSIMAFQVQLNGYFDEVVSNDQAFCNAELGVEEDAPAYDDIEESNTAALEGYRQQLLQAREAYETLQQEQQAQSAQLQQQRIELESTDYTQTLQEINERIESIPKEPYTRIVEPTGTQPSEILGKLGSSIDTVGMFILPEKKIASMAVKAGKAVNIALKARKVRRVIRTVNTAQRAMHLVQNKVGTAQPGLLDYFSAEYWLRRVGSIFDDKPREVIDGEREAERTEELNRLTEQYNQAAEANIQRKLKLGLIQSEEEAMKERVKAQQQAVADAEKEVALRQQEWEQQQKREKARQFKDKYKAYFQKNITTVLKRMVDSQYQTVQANMDMYIQQKNARIVGDLKRKKDDLLSIQSVAEQGKDALEKEISQCQHYLEVVK